MTALFAGLTTLDVVHRLDHTPDPGLKVTSTDFTMAAGGPATNAAVTYAALSAAARTPLDQAGAGSPGRAPASDAPILATALGEGPVSAFLAADLASAGVRVLDATVPASSDAATASFLSEPAVSSIIEHPSGRMVASTNARLKADPARIAAELPERVGVVLIDGHNPALAHAALMLGVPAVDAPEGDENPFALLEARPPHLRVLDGGSWKNWLTPLLGLVDIAVVSEDFTPPLLASADGEQVAEFLRGFGVTRVVRTRGERPVQYWWDGESGDVPVREVPCASTMALATRSTARSCGHSSARGRRIRSASFVSRRRWRVCRCLPSGRGSGWLPRTLRSWCAGSWRLVGDGCMLFCWRARRLSWVRLALITSPLPSPPPLPLPQKSHIIYVGQFLRHPTNVAIPTTRFQILKYSLGNYVRHC